MSKENNSKTYIDPEIIGTFTEKNKASAFSHLTELEKFQMQGALELEKLEKEHDHETKMQQEKHKQEKEAAGCLSWLGWKTSPMSAITTICLGVLVIIAIVIAILSFSQNGDKIDTFLKYSFNILSLLIGFVVGNKASHNIN